MPFLAFFLGPIGRWVGIVAVAAMFVAGVYGEGRVDGKAAYQAKLAREINHAITKGDTARTDALKQFDQHKEIEDDGFARQD